MFSHFLNEIFAHPFAGGGGLGYAFWSGIGSDISEVTLLVGLAAFWRARNCHAHRCWRIGKHHVEGTPYTTCKRHHPTVPGKPTAEHIAHAHARGISQPSARANE